VDVVLDTIGGDYRSRSLRVLREGGLLVSILPRGAKDLIQEADTLGVRAIELLVEADHAGMKAIAALVEAGKLRATIAGSFPLAEAAKAHALGDTGRTAGKLVLVVP
jgi:NADPH:quinone reductase-like Zn-dependent oxidoreductase